MKRTDKRKLNGFLAVAGLTVILAIILAFTAEGQQTAFADTDSTGILTYNTPDANNETAITSCVASATNAEVATALYNITSAGISITEIDTYAFSGCAALTSINLPSTVTKIGSYAFSGSNLNSVTLPPSLIEIGPGAFNGTQIAALSIPASATTFSSGGTFTSMSHLTTVTFEAGRTRIPDYTLRNAANVTSVIIQNPETITEIGSYAFGGCTALTLDIPSTVAKIGSYAFSGSNLNSVTLPPALVEMGIGVFSGTQIASVSIPASVAIFGNGTFAGMSNLTTVTFETGRTSIPDYALSDATNVTKALIPKSVTSIPGSNTFKGCDNMVLYGYHDTYAIEYALENGREYRELPVITTESLPDAYLYIPYYTQIESGDAGNSNLHFQAVGLPLGLSLSSSGELTGAPRAYGTFNVRISLEDTSVEGSDMWPDMIELTLYVAPRPTDAILLNIVNDYIIFDNIGVADPVSGKYIIERYTDEHGNVILRINAGYPFFVRLWIEGIEQILNVEYSVGDGSTRVTIFDQTIQKLDNGEYTAAAEFFENGEHKVVAQNFEIKWKQREDPDNAGGEQTPGTGDPTPDNSNNGVSSGSGAQTSPTETLPAEAPSAPAWDNPFGDVSESDWFYEDVLYAVENELMNGTSATSFSPQTPMTRGMIITVLGR
ncbi:MAG: leucine-rich repeat protein, partial [Clostridiales Family XIII bacterium]|nr:leucine-rich repeat protein [Clostridiales Family XIII bacterium]